MRRLLQALASVLAGAALVCIGFYLSGIVAAKVDPQALGVTANAAFAPLMFLAWGLPAVALWVVIGFVLQPRTVRYALLGATAEIVVHFALALAQPTLGSSLAELYAVGVTLTWPVAFIALLSPLSSLVGAKFRRSVLSTTGPSHNA